MAEMDFVNSKEQKLIMKAQTALWNIQTHCRANITCYIDTLSVRQKLTEIENVIRYQYKIGNLPARKA